MSGVVNRDFLLVFLSLVKARFEFAGVSRDFLWGLCHCTNLNMHISSCTGLKTCLLSFWIARSCNEARSMSPLKCFKAGVNCFTSLYGSSIIKI